MVTDPQTHTHPQTGPITIHCAAKLSAQCNETRSSADADNGLDAFVGQSRSKKHFESIPSKIKKIIVNKK